MQALELDLPPPPNRRAEPRYAYREMFTVGVGDHVLRVDAYNISLNGVSGEIRGIGALREGSAIEIYLHNYRAVSGRVRWARGREVGLAFTEDLANHPRIRALIARMENGGPAVP